MKNLLEFLLIHLVNHPDAVTIEEHEDDRGVVFVLHVHPEDVGRVIGKGGSIIQAIRTIAKIRAIKEGIRAHITLAEPEEEETTETEAAAEAASETTTADDAEVAAE